MNKTEFTYRKLNVILIWMLILGAPYIWFVPDLLSPIKGWAYYAANILITIAAVFVLWRMMDCLPGIKRKGHYWKENNTTVIEYGGRKIALNAVEEILITNMHASSRGINLFIRNNGKKIEFLSETLDKSAKTEDTMFFKIFSQILSENPHLKQEKDIFGDPIEYWYKADKY